MKKITTSIENLSNELFYEIFDYLDGLDIFMIFSKLNYRFNQLIKCSSIQLKIKIDRLIKNEIFRNNSNEMKHQIYSIAFEFSNSSINQFDRSFNNLQSIRIEDIQKDKLLSLLINLSNLPCLLSLNIKTIHLMNDLNDIYRLIFSLPALKSIKLDLYGNECSISIPISNNNQLSKIEYVDISHYYRFDELNALISYTPLLRRLNLSHRNKIDSNIELILPIRLNYLIDISIHTNFLNFDEFDLFIENIYSKLKVLHVSFSSGDITFLHAYRWEKIISENFPQLNQFSLHYREGGFDDDFPTYLGELNQFNSSFWIQRKWLLEIEIYEYNIHYFIRSYKNRWYNYIDSSKSTQLTIKYVYSDEPADILLKHVKRILNLTQIYHLNIEQQISIERLMQIIHLLPDIITLKLNSLTFYRSITFNNQVFPTTFSNEHAKRMKYIYLEKTNQIKDIDFLMLICPQMEYLNIECIKDMNIQLFIKHILNIINKNHYEYLRLLCIYITTADDQMIKQLKKMIDDEKLLLDYTIHRKLYHIYLKWK